jgi:plastocyanin
VSPRRTPALATAALVAALLAGCGSGPGFGSGSGSSGSAASDGGPSMSVSMSPGSRMTESSQPAGSGSTITIHDFAFEGPASVVAGATVTVVNDDPETHSVTADGDGGFDVTVAPGESRTFVAPSEAGSFAYHCLFHSDMHGSLRVR